MIPAEGLPVVPVVESQEHQEASSGFAFVRETLHEITALQSCLTGFKEELSQLRADLEREQTSRKDDNESIRRHLNRSVADESQMRVGLESKLEAFQNLSKTWITSLGKDVMASKERLNALDGTTEQHGSALLAHEERLLGLDAAVALRCTVTDYKQLATTLAELQSEVVRDRTTAQSSLDTASREMSRNMKNAEARLDALQQSQEKSASVLTTEISGLQDKVESLQNFTKTLAKQNDLEILEDRIQKTESSLRAMNEDLCRKAAATAMKSLSDRVTEMGMEAHTTNTKINMTLDEHKGHIGALQKETSKLERQYELERSRVSNCIVALEKEIATKTSAAETDAVSARVSTASNAIQRLETLATTKVSTDTFERLQARIDTMEVSVIRKADSETLGKVAQAVTEQARQLETVSSQVRDQNGRVEVIEGRTETLKDQLFNKAESNNVYTVDGVDGMLRGYYRCEAVQCPIAKRWMHCCLVSGGDWVMWARLPTTLGHDHPRGKQSREALQKVCDLADRHLHVFQIRLETWSVAVGRGAVAWKRLQHAA